MAAWFCKIDDIEHGPLSQAELVKMAGEGRLSADDLVRSEKKQKWYKAGTVKGLKFPAAAGKSPASRFSVPEKPAAVGTSAEASKLLKGLTKRGGSGRGTDVSIPSRPDVNDEWKPAQRAAMQKAARKPLDPRTKKIIWGAAVVMLVLVLFPPHQVPDGFSMPTGWYFSPIFSPPVATVKAEKGLGNLVEQGIEIEMVDEVVEIQGVKTPTKVPYAKSPMQVNWKWLSLECLAVGVIAAGVIGFLAVRADVAQIPDPRPTHPQRRKQV